MRLLVPIDRSGRPGGLSDVEANSKDPTLALAGGGQGEGHIGCERGMYTGTHTSPRRLMRRKEKRWLQGSCRATKQASHACQGQPGCLLIGPGTPTSPETCRAHGEAREANTRYSVCLTQSGKLGRWVAGLVDRGQVLLIARPTRPPCDPDPSELLKVRSAVVYPYEICHIRYLPARPSACEPSLSADRQHMRSHLP